MIDERCELAAERRSVLLAQIDLIVRTIHPEPHRLVRRAPIKIIFELDGYLLCHPRLLAALGLPAPYKINCNGRGHPWRRYPGQRMRLAGSDQLSTAPRQVCSLPTRIALSYLTLWAQRSSSQAQLPAEARSLGANGVQPAGQVLSPIGPAI